MVLGFFCFVLPAVLLWSILEAISQTLRPVGDTLIVTEVPVGSIT